SPDRASATCRHRAAVRSSDRWYVSSGLPARRSASSRRIRGTIHDRARRKESSADFGCVRCDETEIADLAFRVKSQALQPGRDRLVLGVGEGFGIQYRKLQLAAGNVAILLEEGADAIEVTRYVGRCRREVAREIEPGADRFIDRVENFARSLRNREQPVLREIGAPGFEPDRRGEIDREQHEPRERQAGPRECAALDGCETGYQRPEGPLNRS